MKRAVKSMRNISAKTALAMAVCIAAAAHTAMGDTYYVATGGNNDADGSSDTPFATIARGVSAAAASSAPRKVVVRTGEYKIDSVIEISTAMTIESETGNRDDVVIDGQGKTPLVKWTGVYRATLSGLTLANGYCTDGIGQTAGVYMRDGIITNCVVRDCLLAASGDFDAYGAGVRVSSSTGGASYIFDTVVSGNVASNAIPGNLNKYAKGGGIHLTGSAGAMSGAVRGCTVENNIAWLSRGTNSQNHPAAHLCRGGGICAETSGFEITDCIIRGNCATNATPNGKAGCGGGIYAGAAGTVVSNCLIYGNMASALGGGAYASSSVITHCTITNNVLNAVKNDAADVRGAGVFLDGTSAKCLNSIVEDNTLRGKSGTSHNSALSGGGGVGIVGTGALVANCSVSRNTAQAGGAFLVYSGSGAVISNCLVSANSGSAGGGAMVYNKPEGVLVTDCVLTGNTGAGDGGAVCWGKSSGADCNGLAFRNCFVRGNYLTDGEGVFLHKSGTTYSQPLTIEHCTLAANTANCFVVSADAKAAVSNVFCRGNVIFDTRCRVSPYDPVTSVFGPTDADDVYSATTNACYNFTESAVTGFSTEPQYGNSWSITSESFVDAAGGDYRLVRGSGAIDKGGTVQPWMEGRRRMDMGDGTMTVVQEGGYGIGIVRNNAVPRLSNLPEPGCFELWFRPGMLLFFR